jgi:hypothetical protein
MDDAEPIAGEYERGIRHGRRLGAFGALATVRRALRAAGPIPVAQALDRLVSGEDLGEALRQLEDLGDRAGDQS